MSRHHLKIDAHLCIAKPLSHDQSSVWLLHVLDESISGGCSHHVQISVLMFITPTSLCALLNNGIQLVQPINFMLLRKFMEFEAVSLHIVLLSLTVMWHHKRHQKRNAVCSVFSISILLLLTTSISLTFHLPPLSHIKYILDNMNDWQAPGWRWDHFLEAVVGKVKFLVRKL